MHIISSNPANFFHHSTRLFDPVTTFQCEPAPLKEYRGASNSSKCDKSYGWQNFHAEHKLHFFVQFCELPDTNLSFKEDIAANVVNLT